MPATLHDPPTIHETQELLTHLPDPSYRRAIA